MAVKKKKGQLSMKISDKLYSRLLSLMEMIDTRYYSIIRPNEIAASEEDIQRELGKLHQLWTEENEQ